LYVKGQSSRWRLVCIGGPVSRPAPWRDIKLVPHTLAVLLINILRTNSPTAILIQPDSRRSAVHKLNSFGFENLPYVGQGPRIRRSSSSLKVRQSLFRNRRALGQLRL
jgi:hypothetical protein